MNYVTVAVSFLQEVQGSKTTVAGLWRQVLQAVDNYSETQGNSLTHRHRTDVVVALRNEGQLNE